MDEPFKDWLRWFTKESCTYLHFVEYSLNLWYFSLDNCEPFFCVKNTVMQKYLLENCKNLIGEGLLKYFQQIFPQHCFSLLYISIWSILHINSLKYILSFVTFHFHFLFASGRVILNRLKYLSAAKFEPTWLWQLKIVLRVLELAKILGRHFFLPPAIPVLKES